MLSIRAAARYTFLSAACLLALSACSVEVDDELSPTDRAAVLKIEEANDAVTSLQDCIDDLQTCISAAGLNPLAMAACATEAATCGAEGGGLPLPPGLPPIPDPPDIDLQPIFDCQSDLVTCTGSATTPSDVTDCILDSQDCLDGATGGICDSAADLCMSLPVSVPECDQLDLVCA